jgi:hypothetical protein
MTYINTGFGLPPAGTVVSLSLVAHNHEIAGSILAASSIKFEIIINYFSNWLDQSLLSRGPQKNTG